MRPGRRRSRTSEAALLTGIGLAAVVAAACFPVAEVEHGPVLCPIRRFTGIPCPGCGLTRSFVYTVHGHFGDAFSAHAFGPVLVALILGACILLPLRAVRHRPPIRMNRVVTHPVGLLFIASWLGYAVVRMIAAAG